MQRRKLWIKIKVGQAAVYAVVLAATMVAPAGLLAGTTCATPAGSVPCSQGPVRKRVALPAPAAAPSRAAAAKLRQQQVTAQRQHQVGGQRQELLKERQDAVAKQRAGIRSGLNSRNPKSLSSRQTPTG
ncbi:MAG TPA: hypothetical protein VKG66_06600 [Steroidobacteraceae bacterium]|nr:hypothetical protein [Steroidobacteraceae bacterium]